MIRTTLLAAALALTALTPALAQEITASERAACKADYESYCQGTMPGGGRIIKCLASHYEKLAPACKKVVDSKK
jgi:Cysteine rich repeat